MPTIVPRLVEITVLIRIHRASNLIRFSSFPSCTGYPLHELYSFIRFSLQIMVKVSCNCTSYGCDGKEVDRRTQQSHALKDRTAQGLQQADALKEVKDILVQKATEAAGHVIQDQLDTLTHHLATITLTDVASSPKPPILSSSGIYSPLAICPSSQARTRRLLKRLSEIENSVNVLDAEVTTKLYRSELPSFLNSQSFPLASLIGKCHLLDADLVKVTSKSAAVTAAKDTIKNQLNTIARKLQAAKKIWMDRQEVTCLPRPPECTAQYSTGQ
jgi:hypothetical protein